MTTQTLTLFLGGLLISGCALPPVQTRPGPQHPASSDAAETPMPPRSETLAINDAAPARELSPADMKPEMDMKSMGGMKHDTTEMPGLSGAHQHNMNDMKHDAPATMPATTPATGDHSSHGGKG